MPANLPPHYHVLEEKLRKARSPSEKMEILEEMYALLPKHKGTDKLQADIRKRISKLRQEPAGGKGGPARFSHHVPKEGAGQIFLLGGANAGKSALVAALTRAEPEVADYPFTTRKPTPGMMAYEDVLVQLVDIPPLSREFTEPWVAQIARYGDGVLLVADLGDDATLERLEEVLEVVDEAKIKLVQPGNVPDEDDRDRSFEYLPTLVLGAKADREGAAERKAILEEFYGHLGPFLPVSVSDDESLSRLRKAVFDMLGLIRVYSKIPGKPADMSRPFVLPVGATMEEFALEVHRDFVAKLTFARVWGTGRYDGQRVNRDFELSDGDVVELHM